MSHSYVSPRRRAQRTVELLELGCRDKLPWEDRRQHGDDAIRTNAKVQISEDIREWDYGDYEGLTSKQIMEQRQKSGEGSWDIWRDGCPGGEYVNPTTLSKDDARQIRKEGRVRLTRRWETDHPRMLWTGLIGLSRIFDRGITARRSARLKDNIPRGMCCWWRMDIY